MISAALLLVIPYCRGTQPVLMVQVDPVQGMVPRLACGHGGNAPHCLVYTPRSP